MMVPFLRRAAKPEYAKANTAVWWDINTCPIPDGYDARRIRPSIESTLKEVGYSGPVDITIIGYLEEIPEDVLRALSSTGISLKHGRANRQVYDLLDDWQDLNPPPASMMFISDKTDDISLTLVHRQQWNSGYNLLRAYTRPPKYVSVLYTIAEWIWESLLAKGVCPAATEEMDDKPETRIQSSVLRKCTSTIILPEEHMFYCSTCRFGTPSVETFTKHLSGEEHEMKEENLERSSMPDPGYNQPEVEENPCKSKASKKRVEENPRKSKAFKKRGRRVARLAA